MVGTITKFDTSENWPFYVNLERYLERLQHQMRLFKSRSCLLGIMVEKLATLGRRDSDSLDAGAGDGAMESHDYISRGSPV